MTKILEKVKSDITTLKKSYPKPGPPLKSPIVSITKGRRHTQEGNKPFPQEKGRQNKKGGKPMPKSDFPSKGTKAANAHQHSKCPFTDKQF